MKFFKPHLSLALCKGALLGWTKHELRDLWAGVHVPAPPLSLDYSCSLNGNNTYLLHSHGCEEMKQQEGLLCKLPSTKNVKYIYESSGQEEGQKENEPETERDGVRVTVTPVL